MDALRDEVHRDIGDLRAEIGDRVDAEIAGLREDIAGQGGLRERVTTVEARRRLPPDARRREHRRVDTCAARRP